MNAETGLVLAWAIGFGIRFGLHSDPDNSGLYIAYYLFIVLSVSRPYSVTPHMWADSHPRFAQSHVHSSHLSICLWDASRGTSSQISISLSHLRRLQWSLSLPTSRRSLFRCV